MSAAGGAPPAGARPCFTGVWESDEVEGLDDFLAARGVSYLRRCVAVPLQASITQALRHEADDVLVQHSSSRLSTFTQVQRAGGTTRGRDASGAAVTLVSRWEGAVWVVLSRGAGGAAAAAAPIETRRWLEPGGRGLTMRFDVSTLDANNAVVTASRLLRRVSWEAEGVPSAEEAEAGRTVPGSAWSMVFGSGEEEEEEEGEER